jgi:hypothetical protein
MEKKYTVKKIQPAQEAESAKDDCIKINQEA